MFVVDGQQWIADPFAAEQSDDGFGSRNAVLDVRPPVGSDNRDALHDRQASISLQWPCVQVIGGSPRRSSRRS